MTTSSTPAFPNDRIQILALAQEYWTHISPYDAAEEQAFAEAMPTYRELGYLSKEMFVRVARWKSKRNTPRYNRNSEAEVRIATATAFQVCDEGAAITALMALHGVGLRTATAILHWMRPETFPILDVRVLAALEEPEPANYESIAFYSRISKRIRQLATEYALDLRAIDRALWTWGKRRTEKPTLCDCKRHCPQAT